MKIDLNQVEAACKELYIRAVKLLPPDIKQGFARDIGQGRRPGQPVVATPVGQVEMQPQPAAWIGDFRIEIGDVELGRGAVGREAVGGNDADVGERLVHPLTRCW